MKRKLEPEMFFLIFFLFLIFIVYFFAFIDRLTFYNELCSRLSPECKFSVRYDKCSCDGRLEDLRVDIYKFAYNPVFIVTPLSVYNDTYNDSFNEEKALYTRTSYKK